MEQQKFNHLPLINWVISGWLRNLKHEGDKPL